MFTFKITKMQIYIYDSTTKDYVRSWKHPLSKLISYKQENKIEPYSRLKVVGISTIFALSKINNIKQRLVSGQDDTNS